MNQLPTYAYYKEVFSGKPMPFAFVDLDLLRQNIHDIVQRAGDKQIRVASKSVRSVTILKEIMQYGSPYQGIMSFHPREAVFLSQQGFDDILLGYPVWHEENIREVLEEVKKGKTIRFMTDNLSHLQQIDRIAEASGAVAEYCLDIDMSTDFPGIHFGVYRSPLHTLKDVEALYPGMETLKHARLAGIMGYEAQIAGVGDEVKGQAGKNAIVKILKKRSIKDLSGRRESIVRSLKNRFGELNVVNAGGTGSLESSIREAWVTEVTVGSGFFASGLFDDYSNFKHIPSAGFAIEVTRKPATGMYTCHGGGYIASGGTSDLKQPKPYLPEGIKLTKQEGGGEVQTPFHYSGVLNLGDPVFFRHSKAGELCERFNTLYLVEGGKVVDEVPTYRGNGQCFL